MVELKHVCLLTCQVKIKPNIVSEILFSYKQSHCGGFSSCWNKYALGKRSICGKKVNMWEMQDKQEGARVKLAVSELFEVHPGISLSASKISKFLQECDSKYCKSGK